MGEIRKQTIQSSFLTYIGFFVGALNTYFFAKDPFTPEQYGLTQVIISMAQIIAPLATLGSCSFMVKFFPYYFQNLESKKNDLLTLAVILSTIGSMLVFGGAIIFEPLVVRKFSARSNMVVEYYYWILLFAYCYLCFLVLESYMGSLKKTVLPNFLKETFYRLCVLALIICYAAKLINFGTFVILFCSIYILIVIIIVAYLLTTKQLVFSLTISGITKRLKKRIASYTGFIYSGLVINSIARQIDTLALAGAKDLNVTGIYSLNQFTAAVLQVPYRGLQAIAVSLISEAWKNKNYAEVERIYKRSSINLLLISLFLFINIWLNYDDGLFVLGINKKFANGKTVFLILGLYNIFEMGTGVNTALLTTSPAWRFEFYSGIVLLPISIPLNILMARAYGMNGVAAATLITFTLYNIIRLLFIKRRFSMWPFSFKTIYTLLLAVACYLITYLIFKTTHGIISIVFRSFTFSGLFLVGAWALQLTPDLHQVLNIVNQKLKKTK
jgi:O-antigen/teichoic acid export membrane protein